MNLVACRTRDSTFSLEKVGDGYVCILTHPSRFKSVRPGELHRVLWAVEPSMHWDAFTEAVACAGQRAHPYPVTLIAWHLGDNSSILKLPHLKVDSPDPRVLIASTRIKTVGPAPKSIFVNEEATEGVTWHGRTADAPLPPPVVSASRWAAGVDMSGNRTRKGNRTYFMMVRDEALRIGLSPSLALALVHVESTFNPTAVSGKGAYGLTQLMPDTAVWLKVDAKNEEENLKGGLTLLRSYIKHYGSVPTALAAYRSGPGNVARHGVSDNDKAYAGLILDIQRRYHDLLHDAVTSEGIAEGILN